MRQNLVSIIFWALLLTLTTVAGAEDSAVFEQVKA
jgi:hypothetical protein